MVPALGCTALSPASQGRKPVVGEPVTDRNSLDFARRPLISRVIGLA